MLDFEHLGRVLAGKDALRRHRERTGTSGRHKLWSAEETATLRRLYPDYKAAVKALPGRSYYSIRAQALKTGIAQRRYIWTCADIARLRKLASAGASNKHMLAAFPQLREQQLIGALAHYRIRRRRRQFKATGHALLDALRERCHSLGISMVDLDDIARTQSYFARQNWIPNQRVHTEKVAKAIEALGGTLSVAWNDEARG